MQFSPNSGDYAYSPFPGMTIGVSPVEWAKVNQPSKSALYQQPAQFAGVLGQNYGNYAGGLASVGKNYADAWGAYNAGLGSVANANANENSARYGANAMAEAARQGALANLGTAAFGAYGSAANNALAAWGANQQAYNQAAAAMHNSNQQALANYGASRNNALGALGGAYGGIGKAQIGANALANLNMTMSDGGFGGGNGFSATGADGNVASGSYGAGGTGGFGLNLSANRSSNSSGMSPGPALAGLDRLQSNLMDSDPFDRIDRGAQAGRDQIDAQHYSSRGMPSQMLDQTLGGLLTLGGPAYGGVSAGMDQYYKNTQPNPGMYRDILGRMRQGYNTASGQIRGVQNDLGSGYATANQQVNSMWDRSLGALDEFTTPAQREIRAREGAQEQRKTQALNEYQRLMDDERAKSRYDQLMAAYPNQPFEFSGAQNDPRRAYQYGTSRKRLGDTLRARELGGMYGFR